MGSSVLKWLAALGVGAASAGLVYVQTHLGSGPAVDPLVAGLVVGALTKLISYLVAKIPA